MKRIQYFEIPGKPPSTNEVLSLLYGKWGPDKYGALKEEWEKKVCDYAFLNGVQPVQEACALIFVWYEENKRRDHDNVAGMSTKFIIDGLRASKAFGNDGWRWVNGGILHKTILASDKKPKVGVWILEGIPINVPFDAFRKEIANTPLKWKANN